MNELLAYAHIVSSPGVCGGRPRIDGHRIRVQDIAVESEQLGRTPDEICNAHPGLSLAEVHAALAYYHDHRNEILAQVAADRQFASEFQEQHQDSVRPASC